MKLSKQQIKNHKRAEEIISKPTLEIWGDDSGDYSSDWDFVLDNWYPAYNNQIGQIASFFTPIGLAQGFSYFGGQNRVIDLCAGIGTLSYYIFHYRHRNIEIVCVERNPEFVEIGKKILPEATWICGDILDEKLIKSLGRFDTAISNPPYGNIKHGADARWLKYKGSEFEYKVIEVGGYLAEFGAFILPQMSVPFKYSGMRSYSENGGTAKYQKFHKETGIALEMNSGYDTSAHKDEWKGTSIVTEIALCDYTVHEEAQLSLFK